MQCCDDATVPEHIASSHLNFRRWLCSKGTMSIHLPGPATKAPIQWFFLVVSRSKRPCLCVLQPYRTILRCTTDDGVRNSGRTAVPEICTEDASRRVGTSRHNTQGIFSKNAELGLCHVLPWLDWSELRQIQRFCNHFSEYIHLRYLSLASRSVARSGTRRCK